MPGAVTIAAVATPAGEGGISIIRISGPEAHRVAGLVFAPTGAARPGMTPPGTFRHGRFVHPHSALPLDHGLLLLFRAPHSYTGEDVAELHGHGGRAVTAAVLEAVLEAGAISAGPGEFTRRAFLNGRLDLAQAEAVADLVAAEDETVRRAALSQLGGALSAEIDALRRELLELVADTEAALDFDETEGDVSPGNHAGRAAGLRERIRAIRARSREAELCRDGVSVAIAGRPNVGKSSLMNRLLGSERAIVTPHPGTTRDIIESKLPLRGVNLSLMDCAGIREARCEIEAEGVRRARDLLVAAPVVLLVIDSSLGIGAGEREIAALSSGQLVVALNKTDLPPACSPAEVAAAFPGARVVPVSCTLASGIDRLKEVLRETACGGVVMTGSPPWLLNVRQRQVLDRVAQCLERAGTAFGSLGADAGATDLRQALETLGELSGETVTEEILDCIFSRFCLGK